MLVIRSAGVDDSGLNDATPGEFRVGSAANVGAIAEVPAFNAAPGDSGLSDAKAGPVRAGIAGNAGATDVPAFDVVLEYCVCEVSPNPGARGELGGEWRAKISDSSL